jgi:hypothetical protein
MNIEDLESQSKGKTHEYYKHESFVIERKNFSYLESLVISVITPSFEESFDYHICDLKSIYEFIPCLFEVPSVLTSIN